ncbi:MAG: hypothetical protein ACKO2Q_07160 [Actinomycetota bacterium]
MFHRAEQCITDRCHLAELAHELGVRLVLGAIGPNVFGKSLVSLALELPTHAASIQTIGAKPVSASGRIVKIGLSVPIRTLAAWMLFNVHERVVARIVPQISQPTIDSLQFLRIGADETLEGLVHLHCSEKSLAVFRDLSLSNQLVLGRFLNETPLRVPETAKIVVDDIQQNLTLLTKLWLLECRINLTFDKFQTHLSEDFAITWMRFATVTHSDETLAGVLGIMLSPTEDDGTEFVALWIRLVHLFLGLL